MIEPVSSPYSHDAEEVRMQPYRDAFGVLYDCKFYQDKEGYRRFFTPDQLLAGSTKKDGKIIGTRDWQDHTECWMRNGKPFCFTEHLYAWKQKAENCHKAADHDGLRLIVPEMVSWYNPGQTTLVIVIPKSVPFMLLA